MPTDAAVFAHRLDEFSRKRVRGDVLAQKKRLIAEIYRGIVRLTPVDTGRARFGWYVTLDNPSEDVPPEGEYDEPSEVTRLNPLETMELGQQVWLTNNVPYIEELERGSSANAPAGMVGVTLARYTRG